MLNRFLASQFRGPHGAAGRWLLGPLLNHLDGPMMDEAFAALALGPGERVLDLGFGGGRLAGKVLAAGGMLVGVDISAEMVARAERLFAPEVEGGQARFLRGDAAALPLETASVDKAASVNVLYFWPDLLPVMRELARVLVPGGRLVLGFQTPDAVRSWPGHRYGFVAHGEAEIGDAVRAAGFTLLSVTSGHARWVGDTRCLVALRA